MPDRSKDRRRAVDLLFEADQRGRAGDRVDVVELLAQRIADPSGLKPMRTYAAEIVEGVAAHRARIDELLASYSHSWTLDRMPAVDLAILRVGAWELLWNDDVPDAVAVEQATNLAAELSTDESPGFVNGLLGQLQRLAPALRDAPGQAVAAE
ncbi:MAG TPA: transcription antitermination factor NusB [Micrococcales bacterium]|uniref:Transcription antitermination protein NusB n=1 Tax=Miniimonas arenae TaxID=676201 RepID=A0A5C5BF83_9MICO|nr:MULTISPECIES: transcription antitermination factor NusB [Miniimonas]TNU75886.1 transcription antitermination factor NusB [Miniimonas arenae]HCX84787.1 transcription antitermination factor NusB [Micrococcales bacterium]